MGNPLAQLMALLQGSPMSRLPSEPQGIGPGFGLAGARVEGSDLSDVLRNLPEDQVKMGMVPIGPQGTTLLKIEPPVPSGMVRLYRGGNRGKWWTESRDVAEDFALEHALSVGKRGVRPQLSFIDVSSDTARKAAAHPRVQSAAIPAEAAAILPEKFTDPLVKLLWMRQLR